MSEVMAMGSGDFDGLLARVLRERRDAVMVPAGLEQRLRARLAQETVAEPRVFGFAEKVKTRRSSVATWTAVAAHVFVLALLAGASTHYARVVRPHERMLMSEVNAVKELPRMVAIGGGGGAADTAAVTKGRLPQFAHQQIVPPKAPPMIPPKLAVEPAVVVQPDVKMADNAMPNLGMPTAPAAAVGSLGTGSGGGIGSGNGNGIGPGSGGNMGGGVYHVGGGVKAPVVLYSVDPEYSEEARKAKFAGNVMVDLIVDEQGRPTHVRVVRGAGLGLDERAVEAVRQYRFKPATKDGRPVKVDMDIEVNFQIF